MGIENSLERIAIALEKIEERYSGKMCCTTDCCTIPTVEEMSGIPSYAVGTAERYKDPVPDGVSHFATAPGGALVIGEMPKLDEQVIPGKMVAVGTMNREECKRILREKGIKFKDSARTETLYKLLTDANSGTLEHVDAVDTNEEHVDKMLATSASEPKTKDDARNALVALSASKGKDIALNVLKTIGGSDKLSEVVPEKYGAIVDACQKAEAA